MGAIVYRELATGSTPLLTLAGEELVRPLGIGNDWTSIKVVMLCAVTTNGTSPISATTFQAGLISGTSATMGSGNCLNGVLAYAPNRTLTLSTDYYSLSANPYLATVTNGVYTLAGSSSSFTLGPIGKRFLFGIGAVKGSPNWNLYVYYTNSSYYSLDWKPEAAIDFMDFSQNAGVSSVVISGVTYGVSGSTNAMAFNETAGPINTLNIWWSKAQFPLEIYGIWVSRLS